MYADIFNPIGTILTETVLYAVLTGRIIAEEISLT